MVIQMMGITLVLSHTGHGTGGQAVAQEAQVARLWHRRFRWPGRGTGGSYQLS